MTPERWAQIEDLFHRAVECDTKQRTALLNEACVSDPDLQREVEALLSCDASARGHVQAAARSELRDFSFSLVGKVTSHYRILDALGGGGMGLVYQAEDLRLGRQVALKFLPEESARDPAALARFEREARAASALEHANICAIYEFGEHEGRAFLVMPLLQGQTLRELLENTKPETSTSKSSPKSPRRHTLALDQVIDLAIQIANGLEAAHQKGIIHRDIKPANIFVTSQGQAKILDFGLAKLVGAETDGGAESDAARHDRPIEKLGATERQVTPDPLLSRTGVAMGTAGYMSPEQARGERLDGRTDVFSFGLVLYEMATGHRAFEGDTGPALHNAILTQTPVPARQLNPELPAKLEQIITKAVEKDRASRYQTESELLADLQTLRRKVKRGNLLRWRIPAAVAVLALFIAGGVFWSSRRQQPSPQVLPQIKFRPLTINSPENPVRTGSLSPDGKSLVYVDQQGMHVKHLDTGGTQTVAQPDALPKESVAWEIQDAAWLPDSTRFVANAHPATEDQGAWASPTTSIWLFSRQGAPPRKLRENAMYWAVLRDGSISFGINHEHESWLMGPEGEQARKLFDSDEKTVVFGPMAQSSADGNVVMYGQHDSSGDFLLTRDLRGGPPVTIFTPAEMKRIRGDFAWLPDGRLIYQLGDPESGFSSVQDTCNFWTMRIDLHTGTRLENPRRLTNWTGFCAAQLNVTADGTCLAFLQTSGHGTSYVAELGAGGTRVLNSRQFTFDDAYDAIQDWTADSKSVVLGFNRGDHFELHKQSLTADTPQLLTIIPGGLGDKASVSPDGKWIIVATYPLSNLDWPNQIARVPIEGGTPELITTILKIGRNFYCARPPSNRCVLAEVGEDHKQIVVSNFDPIKGRGAELARFDFDPQFDPKVSLGISNISPDGTRFAVSRGPAGPIQVQSFKDRSMHLVHPKGAIYMANLAWTADGKEFYFSNRTKDGMELVHMDLQGNSKVLWKNSGRTWCVPSPDGRYLAINDSKQSANMWMMKNF